MAPYRILVVDDSAFMRQIICDLIMIDPQFEIAGTATNGAEAIDAAQHLMPDALTLDLEMPVMNGLEALEQIMNQCPVPVIMLSGISDENTRETIKALQLGAFDFIRKPSVGAGAQHISEVGERLREKLSIAVTAKGRPLLQLTSSGTKASEKISTEKMTSAITLDPPKNILSKHPETAEKKEASKPNSSSVIKRKTATDAVDQEQKKLTQERAAYVRKTKEIAREFPRTDPKKAPQLSQIQKKHQNEKGENLFDVKNKPIRSTTFTHLVAIGTSTGGPRALQEVITNLPEDFPAPVLVVQHMPPRFTKSLAQRLDSFSKLRAVEAEEGQKLEAGVVYVAPGGLHMRVKKDAGGYVIALGNETQRNGHRPSVDELFESIVPLTELKRHAVIMTGMGSDGAAGMKKMLESGAVTTIAESEDSCIVYGMPRSAMEIGAAQVSIPLQGIASYLNKAVTALDS